MKSTVKKFPAISEVDIPRELLVIKIPSWEEVIRSDLQAVLKDYRAVTQRFVPELTDAIVQEMQIPQVSSLHELKQFLMDNFHRRSVELHFYEVLIPYLLTYYFEVGEIRFDQEELVAFKADYFDRLADFADQAGLDVETYGRQELKLEGDVMAQLDHQAEESFVFKIMAQQYYDLAGLTMTEEDYEDYIQTNVLHFQEDEIALREQLSYEEYRQTIPELTLTQTWFQHLAPKVEFHIQAAEE